MTQIEDLVVAVLPVLGVEPGHVAEARRALLAQGRTLGDGAVMRLLWAARALPAALDALADARSPQPLAENHLLGAEVEIFDAPAPGNALVAVARAESDAIIVDVIDKKALFAAGDDDAAPCCTVRIPYAAPTQPGGDVAVHRFTVRH